MKKRSLISLVLVFAVFVFVSLTLSAEFWASKNSNKYHYPNCRWAQKIKPENLIKFSSPEEAVKAGYVPCKVCKPPLTSKSELKIYREDVAFLLQEGLVDQSIVAGTDFEPWP